MNVSSWAAALALASLAGIAGAQAPTSAVEATIRKAIAERLPNFPKVDEVRASPVPGLYEVRFGTDVRYADAKGEYLLEGDLIELKSLRNLTQERVEKLTAISFASLPLADAIVTKRGTGARRLAVFEDPNCGYCKRFEKGLAEVKDVTIYTFLIPILGPGSREKSRAIWCAKDPYATWQDWMLRDQAPVRPMGKCDDAALERNLAFSRKHRINGTPALIFEDGTRAPGAIPPEQVEERLAQAEKKAG